MANHKRVVYGGVDTHQDTHVAAALDAQGRLLGTQAFPTSPLGLTALHVWLAGHGQIECVGVEGTGSYGAGLTRTLHAAGVRVVEVNRPNRQLRRARGKSDPIDAEAAARAALGGQASATPKTRDGIVEAIRVLKVALDGTRKQMTQLAERIHHLLLTAPDPLRTQLGGLTKTQRITRCAGLRPGTDLTDPVRATKHALRTLAGQYQHLAGDHRDLTTQLDTLTRTANPALRAAYGVGPDTAAALLVTAGDNPHRLTSEAGFAALCGASPIPASSGKTQAMRLNRGGNRHANAALHRIVLVRLAHDPTTQHYRDRRTSELSTTAAVQRCLKRYVAREMYRLLTNPPPVLPTNDLRDLRTTSGLTQTAIAHHLNTTPAVISRIERGKTYDPHLITAYRHLLQQAKPAA
ncbi:MAG: IS110 family transposase [Candidatus Nanopelagicales bacterium]